MRGSFVSRETVQQPALPPPGVFQPAEDAPREGNGDSATLVNAAGMMIERPHSDPHVDGRKQPARAGAYRRRETHAFGMPLANENGNGEVAFKQVKKPFDRMIDRRGSMAGEDISFSRNLRRRTQLLRQWNDAVETQQAVTPGLVDNEAYMMLAGGQHQQQQGGATTPRRQNGGSLVGAGTPRDSAGLGALAARSRTAPMAVPRIAMPVGRLL